MKVLGLIPARGGSKGFPGKNLALLRGKPLLAHAVEAALKARSLSAVVVSTDSPEIAAVARTFGAEVPFMRPEPLAGDEIPDGPVMAHALEALAASGREYDAVALLRPTTPLRTSADIDGAVALFASSRLPVRSVSEVRDHPFWMKIILPGGVLSPLMPGKNEISHPRRQTLPPVFVLNGVIDVAPADLAVLGANLMFASETLSYPIPRDRTVDIDSPFDLAMAEALLNDLA